MTKVSQTSGMSRSAIGSTVRYRSAMDSDQVGQNHPSPVTINTWIFFSVNNKVTIPVYSRRRELDTENSQTDVTCHKF